MIIDDALGLKGHRLHVDQVPGVIWGGTNVGLPELANEIQDIYQQLFCFILVGAG